MEVRTTKEDYLYYASDLNAVLSKEKHTYAITNADCIAYKENFKNKKILRFMESKHMNEVSKTKWQSTILSIIDSMSKIFMKTAEAKKLFHEVAVYTIYTNVTEWYGEDDDLFKAIIVPFGVKKHQGKVLHGSIGKHNFFKFCACECFYNDLTNLETL